MTEAVVKSVSTAGKRLLIQLKDGRKVSAFWGQDRAPCLGGGGKDKEDFDKTHHRPL